MNGECVHNDFEEFHNIQKCGDMISPHLKQVELPNGEMVLVEYNLERLAAYKL